MTEPSPPNTGAIPDTEPSLRRNRRAWLWPLLVASLALNLLIAGALVGASLSWRYAKATGGPQGEAAMMGFMPPADRGGKDTKDAPVAPNTTGGQP